MLAFCSETRTVTPCSCSRVSTAKTCWTMSGARPIDGSSSSNSRGSDISARPMASICCSPPDSVPASCDKRSSRRGNMESTNARRCSTARSAALEAGGRSFVKAPICRFSCTVSGPKTWRPSGTSAMPRGDDAAPRCERLDVVGPRSAMLPRTGRNSPGDGFHRRGLAGAVGADERAERAGGNREGHVVEHFRRSVAGVQAGHLKHGSNSPPR